MFEKWTAASSSSSSSSSVVTGRFEDENEHKDEHRGWNFKTSSERVLDEPTPLQYTPPAPPRPRPAPPLAGGPSGSPSPSRSAPRSGSAPLMAGIVRIKTSPPPIS